MALSGLSESLQDLFRPYVTKNTFVEVAQDLRRPVEHRLHRPSSAPPPSKGKGQPACGADTGSAAGPSVPGADLPTLEHPASPGVSAGQVILDVNSSTAVQAELPRPEHPGDMAAAQRTLPDALRREVRNLTKKLRQIEELEKRQGKGEDLDAYEKEKLSRKPGIHSQLCRAERQLAGDNLDADEKEKLEQADSLSLAAHTSEVAEGSLRPASHPEVELSPKHLGVEGPQHQQPKACEAEVTGALGSLLNNPCPKNFAGIAEHSAHVEIETAMELQEPPSTAAPTEESSSGLLTAPCRALHDILSEFPIEAMEDGSTPAPAKPKWVSPSVRRKMEEEAARLASEQGSADAVEPSSTPPSAEVVRPGPATRQCYKPPPTKPLQIKYPSTGKAIEVTPSTEVSRVRPTLTLIDSISEGRSGAFQMPSPLSSAGPADTGGDATYQGSSQAAPNAISKDRIQPPPQFQRFRSANSHCFRCQWRVDAKKLEGSDKSAVSPAFELDFGADFTNVTCKLMIYPKVVSGGKGGASFKKAEGRVFVQLKCEAELPEALANVHFSIGCGEDAKRTGNTVMRGPNHHNFSISAVCGLPKDKEEWHFKDFKEVQSNTFLVILDIQLRY